MKHTLSTRHWRQHRSRWHWFTLLALLACGILGGNSHAAAFAEVTAHAPTSTGLGALRTLLSLVLVLGLIFAVAWLLRRVRMVGGGPTARLQLVAQLSLGTRERVVWLRAGERELLLGVAPGQVRTLLVLGAEAAELAAAESIDPAFTAGGGAGDSAAAAEAANRPSFRALLMRSLGR